MSTPKIDLEDDEVIIRNLLYHVKDYVTPGNPMSLDECMHHLMKDFISLYSASTGSWIDVFFKRRNGEVEQKCQDIFKRVEPKLREKVEKKIFSLKKARRVRKIHSVTTEALLSEALHRAGLTYHIEFSNYHARIYVLTKQNTLLQTYVRFKEATEPRMQEIVDSIKVIVENAESIERDLIIVRNRPFYSHIPWKT